MSEVPLAHKYSAETYDQALSNLIERWKQGDSDEPVKYKDAAIGVDKSTVSVALKFLGEIGFLEVPKAGSYIVPEEVLKYRTMMGDVKRNAKQEVESRLDEYPLYSESKFMLGLNEYTLDELAEDVSGSAEIAATQDELSDVKRSLRILAKLGFFEIDEEGKVSVPDDMADEAPAESPEEGTDPETDTSTESEGTEQDTDVDDKVVARQHPNGGTSTGPERVTSLVVDMDLSMDVTEMGKDEIREKLEVINDIFDQNEK